MFGIRCGPAIMDYHCGNIELSKWPNRWTARFRSRIAQGSTKNNRGWCRIIIQDLSFFLSASNIYSNNILVLKMTSRAFTVINYSAHAPTQTYNGSFCHGCQLNICSSQWWLHYGFARNINDTQTKLHTSMFTLVRVINKLPTRHD
jgi:hypothetical protein